MQILRFLFLILVLLLYSSPIYVIYAKEDYQGRISADKSANVPPEVMQTIYQEVKTPYKYGIVLRSEDGKKID